MKLYGKNSNLNYKIQLGFQSNTSAVRAVPYFLLLGIHVRDLTAEL